MSSRAPDKTERMHVNPDASLGTLVTRLPELARIFEQYGLDYCCGGAQSLRDACRAAGVDVAAVVDDLARLPARAEVAEWASMGAAELVDHLESTHHRYLWTELPRIQVLVDKIEAVHGGRHPELAEVAKCYAEVRADLEPHLHKEEQVLFPMIRELASATTAPTFHCGSLRNPISVMLVEHDAVGALLARLRTLTGGYEPPADGCATYEACYAALRELEADTHLHIHKENNLLFPMVQGLEAGRVSV